MTPPSLTVPANVTVEATGPTTPVTFAAATASDAVSGLASLISTQASGSLFPVGVTTVSVTATDNRGNSVTKSFTVTVKDTTAPVITTTYANISLEATGVGTPVSYAAAAATDAVGVVSYSYSTPTGSLFPIGSTLMTVTAYDAAGNHSSKSFTVTIKDTTAPVVTATNITVEATQSSGFKTASASFTPAVTWSDASGSVTLSYTKSVGTVLPFGNTTVTVTATDGSGNHSSATFTVTVQDHTAPVLAPLPNLTLEATSSAGAKATYSPSASDAVGPVTITTSIPSGTIFPIGTTTVNVTAADGHGNVSTTSFTVTVQDTTAPTINAPLYLVAEATSLSGAVVNYPSFATDIDGPVTYTYSIPSGTLFPLSFSGPVTMTATDSFGNTSTATFTLFVHDSTSPVFTFVSGNLTIEATSAAGAVVNYLPATATDALAPPIYTYSKASGSTFAIGTTTVKVTAIDIVGNTTTKTFTVTVRDTTAPVITSVPSPAPFEATSSAGAVVTYAPAVAFDVVGPVTYSYSKASGSTFAIGTTTVTVTAKDAYGNVSTPRTFTVTVRDTTAPTFTSVSGNLTIEATSAAGAVVNYATATATDLTGTPTITYSKASGTTFGFGTTTVIVTAKDGYGNISTTSFTVTVQDHTPPAITAPNLTIEATGSTGALVSFAPTITDAVGLASVTYTVGALTISSGSLFAIGTTTVTVTAIDVWGNVSTKTFTVTVRDTTPPVFTSISSDITVTTTSSSGIVVNYNPATATDNTGGAVTITYSVASGTKFAVGTTVVTVTATDVYGNKTTKTFKVTVVKH